MTQIYMDHASTTYLDPEILKSMLPYFTEQFGNPDSQHKFGYQAKEAVDNARKTIAQILNCKNEEIIFTGSGTEANNLAILGTARANKEKGKHIITSNIEHSSILESLKYLEKNEGFTVTYLDVSPEGFIDPQELKEAITPETTLVSIIYANNEIGTIQNIKEIGEICQEKNITFHTDACQAASLLNIDTEELNIDMMTLNASKIYGPKGVGLLYKKKSIAIEAIIHGGGQELGLRSGTTNTPLIVGFAKALELAQENKEKENKRLSTLRDKAIEAILNNIPKSALNGSQEERLPNNINIYIPNIDNKELLLHLDEAGISASIGSACSSGKSAPSHVLKALNLPEEKINSSIRISLGKKNTEKDIEQLIASLVKITKNL